MICAGSLCHAQRKNPFDLPRKKMVEMAVVGAGVTNKAVIKSLADTPRHEFVPSHLRDKAYFDMALPIGEKQTISSPFIVAYMTEALDPQPNDKVLEIGTGSGYQAAILSPLVAEVYTIEIVESLGRRAQRTLKRLRYKNVHAKVGDGYKGWPEHAPFDKIIVTCSPEKVPRPLFDQLREGGAIVIPVGERYQQTLYVMRKTDGKLKAEALRPTLFVPMTGAAEARREVQPDPKNPRAVNGGFEEGEGENEFVRGWYYQRQCKLVNDGSSPAGDHHVSFKNTDEGRDAHLLQGFPIDGSTIEQLSLSAQVKFENLQSGTRPSDLPMIAVSFYDKDRKDLGYQKLGPFRGTAEWHLVEKTIQVPPKAREGILRLTMLGAIGEISVDDVRMTPVRK